VMIVMTIVHEYDPCYLYLGIHASSSSCGCFYRVRE
jgi:hypothetical protein